MDVHGCLAAGRRDTAIEIGQGQFGIKKLIIQKIDFNHSAAYSEIIKNIYILRLKMFKSLYYCILNYDKTNF